jgi:hypothetical protein
MTSKSFPAMMDFSPPHMRSSGSAGGGSCATGYALASLEFLIGTAFGFAVGAIVGVMWWEGRNESQKDKFRY